MKTNGSLSIFSMLSFFLFASLITSCDKEVDPKFLPVLTTTEVVKMTEATAYSGGNITSDAGSDITSRGVCWSESPNPTIEDKKTIDAAGTGVFESRIVGLNPSTKYYIRAYASNKKGVGYGLQVSFKTKSLSIITTPITGTSINSAISGGTIETDGDSLNVTERGVCWSTSAAPTIVNEKTINGGGLGSFTSSITGLIEGTTYYVRAYATNSVCTIYGNAYQFTTHIKPIPNTVLIPAGKFTMGSPMSEVKRSTYETQHSVTLSSFRMSKYEITNSQYNDFLNAKHVGSNGLYAAGAYPTQKLIYSNSSMGLIYSGSQWITVPGYESYPAINVTWYGAAEFATYVGGTLPTEAQWEYACRAGTTTPFNTGNFLTNLQANYIWTEPYNGGNNTVTINPDNTQTVGKYTPNAYGLYDMHGNVWEWCADWYGVYPTSAQTNPTGAALLFIHNYINKYRVTKEVI